MVAQQAAYQSSRSAEVHEANWRLGSAAAHGKDWAVTELQVFTSKVEWRPDQFHRAGHVDPLRLTEILSDTIDLVILATAKYLMGCGIDPDSEFPKAVVSAARTMRMNDGGRAVDEVANFFGVN